MHIEINTDYHIDGQESLRRQIEIRIELDLDRHKQNLTLVDVCFTDGEGNKCCHLQACPKGLDPLMVEHLAASLDLAFEGAMDKLKVALNHLTLGISDQRVV